MQTHVRSGDVAKLQPMAFERLRQHGGRGNAAADQGISTAGRRGHPARTETKAAFDQPTAHTRCRTTGIAPKWSSIGPGRAGAGRLPEPWLDWAGKAGGTNKDDVGEQQGPRLHRKSITVWTAAGVRVAGKTSWTPW